MDDEERRELVRELVVSGEATGPKDLARHLADAGCDVGPDVLKRDLRALGAVRVVSPDGPVLAIAIDASRASAAATSADGGAPRSTSRDAGGTLTAQITSDPDWPLQVVVAAVALAFFLVALVAWLLGS